jgi:signal transduction histidine kinase
MAMSSGTRRGRRIRGRRPWLTLVTDEVAPHVDARPKALPVATILERAADRIAELAATANVEVFVRCGGGELLCDERLLVEALFNLLAGAIDATPRGGAVFLATYETTSGDQYWVVQGTSGGAAARKDTQSYPFRAENDGGAGLGLAIARALIAAHGGLISVESHPGAGTKVAAWLPSQGLRRTDQGRFEPI